VQRGEVANAKKGVETTTTRNNSKYKEEK